MSELNVKSGETHTIPEGESETRSEVDLEGTLNLGGTLNIGAEPETQPTLWAEHIDPNMMVRILRNLVNFALEVADTLPPLFDQFSRGRSAPE